MQTKSAFNVVYAIILTLNLKKLESSLKVTEDHQQWC